MLTDKIIKAVHEDIPKINSQLEQKANKNEVGTPLIASSVSEMIDKTKVYVNTTDNYWYSWNGSAWAKGGVYNSQGIADGSISPLKLSKQAIVSDNFSNFVKLENKILYVGSTLQELIASGYFSTNLINISDLPSKLKVSYDSTYFQGLQIDSFVYGKKKNGSYSHWVYSSLPTSFITKKDGYIEVNIDYLRTDWESLGFNLKSDGYIKVISEIEKKFNFDWLDIKLNNLNDEIIKNLYKNNLPNLDMLNEQYNIVVGKEFNIYEHSLIPFTNSNYYLNFSYSGLGAKRYKDRFSIVPTVAGTFNLTIEIYESVSGISNIINSKTVKIKCLNDIVIPSKKVMFLGDSRIASPYIGMEFGKLCNNNVEFLGTIIGSSEPKGVLREGRAGWTAEQYCTTQNFNGRDNAFYNSNFTEVKYGITSHFDFSTYMSTQGYTNVDDVFIMLGANDGFTQQAINSLKIIIENIYKFNSSVKIHLICEYISPLLEIEYNGTAVLRKQKQMEYYKMYKGSFTDYTTLDIIPTNVVTDDFYDFPRTTKQVSNRNIETRDMVTDLVHLNQYGYYKIADMCYFNFVNSLSN